MATTAEQISQLETAALANRQGRGDPYSKDIKPEIFPSACAEIIAKMVARELEEDRVRIISNGYRVDGAGIEGLEHGHMGE